jgi:hypothetical protein
MVGRMIRRQRELALRRLKVSNVTPTGGRLPERNCART